MTDQPPGIDWQAKHAAAGTQSDRPQHPTWTTADGPVQQHEHPMGDAWVIDRLEQARDKDETP